MLFKLSKCRFTHTNKVFRGPFSITTNIEKFNTEYKSLESESEIPTDVKLAGRIIGIRKANKNIHFLDVSSNGHNLQVKYDKRHLNESEDNIDSKDLNRGDIIGIVGNPCRTKAGELSLSAKSCIRLSECVHNMPMMNWTHTQTLKDMETRFHKRYLDLICNNSVKDIFVKRAKMINCIRSFMNSEGYLEVETPLLNAQAGGALARPFKTYANEIDSNLELRIAPELYLKQLIIGGFEKVYEIGKVFRNEGIDTTHNPEFTTIEFYEAYSNYLKMMDTTEKLLKHIFMEMFGSLKVAIPRVEIKSDNEDSHEHKIFEIDLSQPFQKFDVMTEIQDHFGEKIDLADKLLRLKLEGMLSEGFPKKYKEGMNEKQLLDKLIEGVIEQKCNKPSYI